MTANGDKQGYYACGFYGYQDTLYAKAGKQYYSNCYIEGAVDFIFGAAAAWFGECTIASNGGGAITANSRSSTTDTTWYVIDSSTVSWSSCFVVYFNVSFLVVVWSILTLEYRSRQHPDIVSVRRYT